MPDATVHPWRLAGGSQATGPAPFLPPGLRCSPSGAAFPRGPARGPSTHRGSSMNLRRAEAENAGRAAGFRRGAADRERHLPAQAGHDVRGPQAARRKRRADLRRRRARGAVGRASAFCARRKPITWRARTTSMSARTRCAVSACAPAIPSRARSARRATASVISRCSRSTSINFDEPDRLRHRINFDNLTPALSRKRRLQLELDDPTRRI